jgi:nitrite reductase/ring-hydroxylating ferredoxin subunit
MVTKEQSIADSPLTRREFLSRVWLLMGVATAGEAIVLGLRYWGSRSTNSPFGTIIDLGKPADYPSGTITEFLQARFYLVRFEDGGFLALHNRCTHLACVVSWNALEGRFNCPCHGSHFDRKGAVINAPAPRPLDVFPVTVTEEKIEVDTRQPMRRQAIDSSALAYLPQE